MQAVSCFWIWAAQYVFVLVSRYSCTHVWRPYSFFVCFCPIRCACRCVAVLHLQKNTDRFPPLEACRWLLHMSAITTNYESSAAKKRMFHSHFVISSMRKKLLPICPTFSRCSSPLKPQERTCLAVWKHGCSFLRMQPDAASGTNRNKSF